MGNFHNQHRWSRLDAQVAYGSRALYEDIMTCASWDDGVQLLITGPLELLQRLVQIINISLRNYYLFYI